MTTSPATATPLTRLDVRAVRVDLRLSQREFGDLLGAHNVTVSKWENGREKPSRHRAHIIAAMQTALENGPILDLADSLDACGPAYALWRVFDTAYSPD